MIQPGELKKNEPLVWSTGTGTDVWALFQACIHGDLVTVKQLIDKEPSLVRCQHHYRQPLYFSVRENRLAVTEFLLERDTRQSEFIEGDMPPSEKRSCN